MKNSQITKYILKVKDYHFHFIFTSNLFFDEQLIDCTFVEMMVNLDSLQLDIQYISFNGSSDPQIKSRFV